MFLYAGHALPVGDVRRKLHEILQDPDKWDRKAWGLLVTNSTYFTMELSALTSAANSAKMAGLRCYVGEKLLALLAANYPPQPLPPWEEEKIPSTT